MAHEAPHLMEAIAAQAREMGIQPPQLFISDFGPLGKYPNAAALGSKYLLLNEPMLRAMNSTLSGQPSRELMAVVGHEMGHLRHIVTEKLTILLPIPLLPVAAMMGLHVHERARARSKHGAATMEDIEHVVHEETADLEAMKQYPDPKAPPFAHDLNVLGKDMLNIAKYVAVGLAGLAAGLFSARCFSNHYEFRNDKIAAKLTDPQAMIRAFEMMEREALAIYRREGPTGKPNLMARLIQETIQAHPETPVRIARLAAM